MTDRQIVLDNPESRPMKNNSVNYSDFKKVLLSDNAVLKEYKALNPQFYKIRRTILLSRLCGVVSALVAIRQYKKRG